MYFKFFVVRELVTREGFKICRSAHHKKNFNNRKTKHIVHTHTKKCSVSTLKIFKRFEMTYQSIRLIKIKNHNVELRLCREISSLLVGIAHTTTFWRIQEGKV